MGNRAWKTNNKLEPTRNPPNDNPPVKSDSKRNKKIKPFIATPFLIN